MVRRNRPADPPLPLPQPHLARGPNNQQPQPAVRLAAGANLRTILNYERDQRTAAGWTCDEIGRVCSLSFAQRDGARTQLTVERYDPAGPGRQGIADRSDGIRFTSKHVKYMLSSMVQPGAE
jgi:hypothetical protein